jgi:hypothetical protein
MAGNLRPLTSAQIVTEFGDGEGPYKRLVIRTRWSSPSRPPGRSYDIVIEERHHPDIR